MKVLDKEAVNQRILEVCEHYLGAGSGNGERRVWACPGCNKKNFRVHASRGVGGCFSAGCDIPTATDAIGIIGYFEGLADHGREFRQRVQKGYEVLGLQTGPTLGPATTSGHHPVREAQAARENSDNANGDTANGDGNRGGDHDGQRIQWVAGAGPKDERCSGTQPATDGARHADDAAANKDKNPRRRVRERPLRAYVERPGGMRKAVQAVRIEKVDEESYRRETADAVYRRILELCPVQKRDIAFWEGRGVSAETVERGRFGSLCRERHRHLPAALGRAFDEEELLSVGGFYRTQQGQIGFNLRGDYALIPYHDAQGYITTLEGRLLREPKEGEAKYKALLDSGSHLYVFPEYDPQEIVAFCEGVIGAIVAAQSGLAVGSIKGFRAYRWCSSEGGYGPLPELRDVDFGGKKVFYIPDTDVKPKVKEEVEAEAPVACEWLITCQNGRPKLAQLPGRNKDLDEWLLNMSPDERVEAFAGLMRKAVSPEEWLQESQERTNGAEEEEASADTLLEILHNQAQVTGDGGEASTVEVPVEPARSTQGDAAAAVPANGTQRAQNTSGEATPASTAAGRGALTDEQGSNEGSAHAPQSMSEDSKEGEQYDPQPKLAGVGEEGSNGGGAEERTDTDQPNKRAKKKTRKKKTRGGQTETGKPSYRKQLELEEYGSPEPELAKQEGADESSSEEKSAENASTGEKAGDSSGEEQTSGNNEQNSASGADTPVNGTDQQQQVRHKRQLRPSQQKWYDSLEKPTIYRSPEERKKKPKPEPERPSTDHIRPEYVNWAEVVLILFIVAVITAVAWIAGEYLLAEAVLSSPLGRLEATGWISRMSFYVFVGCGVSFGVWLWRYKRRRRALIRHLTGGARSS